MGNWEGTSSNGSRPSTGNPSQLSPFLSAVSNSGYDDDVQWAFNKPDQDVPDPLFNHLVKPTPFSSVWPNFAEPSTSSASYTHAVRPVTAPSSYQQLMQTVTLPRQQQHRQSTSTYTGSFQPSTAQNGYSAFQNQIDSKYGALGGSFQHPQIAQQAGRGRQLSLPENSLLPNVFPSTQQRPVTSAGYGLNPYYSMAGPDFVGSANRYQLPPQATQFSHNPFPYNNTVYTPRPFTADARYVNSRPSTATTMRPGTAETSMSTLQAIDAQNQQSGNETSGSIDQEGNLFRVVGLPSSQKKRARRKFDEIERMYDCSYPGCNKSYGCLNHLNAHVAAQKHGLKRLPSEFKELRKAWRTKKKAEEAAKRKASEGERQDDAEETDRMTRSRPSTSSGIAPGRDYSSNSAVNTSNDSPFAFAVPSSSRTTTTSSMPFNPPAMQPQTAPSPYAFSITGLSMPRYGVEQSMPQHPPAPNSLQSDDLGALGLPRRRGSLPTNTLASLPELAQFQLNTETSQSQRAYPPPNMSASFNTYAPESIFHSNGLSVLNN